MTDSHSTIKCPKCDHEFDISDVLFDQVEHKLKGQFDAELKKERDKFRLQTEGLQKQREELEKSKGEQESIVAKAIKEKMKAERKELEEKISNEVRDEQSEQLKMLREELDKKSGQVKDLNKAHAEIERLKREKDEAQSKAEADAARKLNEILASEREKIQKSEEEKQLLKVRDKEHVIQQLNEKLRDLQRKAEQGSMQTQGEVQELVIEEWLRANYTMDNIEEIKKGAKGGDCIQTVRTRSFSNCGTIYYESKRTKAFQPNWIDKFKADIQEKNATIGVLVTEVMPADMERMGVRDGVWICSFSEFKGLSNVLRESIIGMHRVLAQQENRGDKMSLIYGFVTSNEFRLQVEAIVEGFTQMETDLNSEKRAMASIWKKREKQIEKVLTNTIHMHSSIKGIAGAAVPAVRLLELPGSDESENT